MRKFKTRRNLVHAKTIVHPESLLLLLDLEELCEEHHIGHINNEHVNNQSFATPSAKGN